MLERKNPYRVQLPAAGKHPIWTIALVLIIAACAQTGGTTAEQRMEAPPAPAMSGMDSTDEGWPREIITAKGTIVIYQPQPEKLAGDRLSARAAIAIELKGGKEPVYGAVWMDSRLETDRSDRTATITEISVTQMRLPEKYREHTEDLGALLETEIPKWNLPISLDRLLTSLDLAQTRSEASQKIITDPPRILFSTEPAVLISIDGEPRLQQEDGSALMRVINTPFTLLLDPSSNTYYLNADAEAWYQSGDILGEWSLAKQVPAEVAKRAPKVETEAKTQQDNGQKNGQGDGRAGEPGPPSRIVIATEPTELIVTEGKPEFTPVAGTELLFMSNTDSDVLLDVASQQYYVVLAGRWYISSQLDGKWSYVKGGNLPADFANIPEDSDVATVLYAVPGTELSKEAVLDAHIPQTAKIDRNRATLEVEYDGEPKFESIAGIGLHYAVNAALPVIRADAKYYAVDNGVWFVASKATGPWQVATSVPVAIYTIEPDSPLYPVTFVRIYKVTPEFVYVGYTPGYTNTYVYESTIVYGTGYWYPGWYGRYYYPRPATWGFGVRWNPWTGWGFGFSYSAGPFTFGIGRGSWYRGGWWGPSRYRGYRQGYRHGYRRGYDAGYHRGTRQNLYNNHGQARVARDQRQSKRANVSANRANNVYTDRKGDVYRKTDQGWQTRSSAAWQASNTGANRPETLNRSSKARQRGTQRAGAYRQSRGRGGRGGGRRGP
ncbi:carbohydrate-binding family V/XII [Gammaproteobacteria bacterium]|nr:carbohydrate-binding family V/XII [Gammaproteobacteria bacterium]